MRIEIQRAAAFISAILMLSVAAAAKSGVIVGRWVGSGYAHVTNGESEKVRCRISYDRQSAKTFTMHAVCASPSTRILQTGTVLQATDNTYIGHLHNQDFNVKARVRIVVSGSIQTIYIKADEGSGKITLRKR